MMSDESNKNNEIEELKRKVEDLESKIKHLESKYNKEALLESVVESLAKIFTNKDVIKNLLGLGFDDTESINNIKSINEEENINENNDLNSFHESQNQLISSFQKENQDLKKENQDLEEKNKNLNDCIVSLEKEKEDLNKKIEKQDDEFKSLSASKKNLEKKLETSEEKNNSLDNLRLKEEENHKAEIKRYIEDIERIKEKMNSEISKLESELNLVKENLLEEKSIKEELEKEFFEEKRIYNLYLGLGSESKESLKGIFKNKGLKAFLSIISQYKSIESLFDFTQRCIMENKLDDLDSLKEIIKFALGKHNSIYSEPIYVMQNIKEGDIFDVDDEAKTPSSNNAGTISKVYIQGYVNINLNKVVKKAVVEI